MKKKRKEKKKKTRINTENGEMKKRNEINKEEEEEEEADMDIEQKKKKKKNRRRKICNVPTLPPSHTCPYLSFPSPPFPPTTETKHPISLHPLPFSTQPSFKETLLKLNQNNRRKKDLLFSFSPVSKTKSQSTHFLSPLACPQPNSTNLRNTQPKYYGKHNLLSFISFPNQTKPKPT